MNRAVLALMALGVLVSACAEPVSVPEPAPGTAVITVSSGGFFGSTSTQVYADGTLISSNSAPGKPPVRVVQLGPPSAYDRAAAVLQAEGQATKRALTPHAQQCLDYGMDMVAATPPVAGFDQAAAACPDAAVSALMSHVLAALAQP